MWPRIWSWFVRRAVWDRNSGYWLGVFVLLGGCATFDQRVGFVDEGRAVGEQALHRRVKIRHLQGKADLPAHALPGFQLIDNLGLSLIKQLERGFAHV